MQCDNPFDHDHICALRAAGRHDEIRARSDQPKVTCGHCGSKANDVRFVCAAHLVDKAPNVEGGHGFVPLEEIGQPHAGPKKGR